ncbi:chromate transporter [Alkalispirochaeta alkalica]|uniref:chromate transporter n=1 Tax=Alkalispirochaeta alkalica TaxID=46356 RepID=UPI000360678C|nr:chromate transporter [Alkalispirochaeta alkalica]
MLQEKSDAPARPVSVPRLFLSFLRIGAFTIGGGYAMVPLIGHELVKTRGWLREETFEELLLVGQSAPGPIAVNTALLAGYRLAGIPGALAGVLGTITAPFFIILIVAAWATEFLHLPAVASGLAGIRSLVVSLMVLAAWRMVRRNHGAPVMIATGGLLALLILTDLSPFLVVLGALLAGAALGALRGRS